MPATLFAGLRIAIQSFAPFDKRLEDQPKPRGQLTSAILLRLEYQECSYYRAIHQHQHRPGFLPHPEQPPKQRHGRRSGEKGEVAPRRWARELADAPAGTQRIIAEVHRVLCCSLVALRREAEGRAELVPDMAPLIIQRT